MYLSELIWNTQEQYKLKCLKFNTTIFGAWRRPLTPHLEPRLKKECSYTSTPLWAFVACSKVNFTFYLYIITLFIEHKHNSVLITVQLSYKNFNSL